jgi:hypothetical protein
MKKILLMILLVIVVAGVSGGGVYYWQKGMLDKEKTNLEKELSDLQKQVVQKQTSIQPQNIMNNTSEYTDNNLGFSITYPNEWQTKPELCKDEPQITRCSDYVYPFQVLGKYKFEILKYPSFLTQHKSADGSGSFEEDALILANKELIFQHDNLISDKSNETVIEEKEDDYIITSSHYKSFNIENGKQTDFYMNQIRMIDGLGDYNFIDIRAAYTDEDLKQNPNVKEKIINMFHSIKKI